MATLPYSVQVSRHDPALFHLIHTWCFNQWPHTYQATWYEEWIIHPFIRGQPYMKTWRFQREEDAKLFTLTWS
jgi:hypothetical protein